MNDLIKKLIYCISFFIGKIPLWVLFAGFFIKEIKFSIFITALIPFLFIKGFNTWYETEKGTLYGHISAQLWTLILKPLLILLFLDIAYTGCLIALITGDKISQFLILVVFLCFTVIVIFSMFIQNRHNAKHFYVNRNLIFKITTNLLWLYAVVSPDGMVMTSLTVMTIFTLEFLTTIEYHIPKRRVF